MNTNNIYTLSLDQSTKNTGYAIWHTKDKPYKSGVINTDTKEKNAYVRTEHMYNEVKKIIEAENIRYVVFEETFAHNNIDTMKKLCRLQGSIMALCMDRNINYYLLLPTEWRKNLGFVGRKRDLQKQQAVDFCNQKWCKNFTLKNEDEAEALCLGYSFLNFVIKQ